MTCGNIQSSPASASYHLDTTTKDYHFAYISQLLSRRTVIECVSSLAYSNILDRVHWVIYLQHQLVAFVDSRVWPSTVDAVSVSSCIGPTVINDPARVPGHVILTVSTSVKIILADLGSTAPAVLTLLVDHQRDTTGARAAPSACPFRTRRSPWAFPVRGRRSRA